VVSLGAGSASGQGSEASTEKVILFSSDGMRPDLRWSKACYAGGTAQFYINLVGRHPEGIVPVADYENVRNQIIQAFQNLTDPQNPGKQVVLAIFRKEQLSNVDGTNSLNATRSGDVVVVLRPPYQYDAATPAQRIAFSQFFGQHGYLPNLVNIQRNVNMQHVRRRRRSRRRRRWEGRRRPRRPRRARATTSLRRSHSCWASTAPRRRRVRCSTT